jgi:hypothetical protein
VCRAVEKSSPFRGLKVDARSFSRKSIRQTPAVWTGFFIVPSSAANPEEMD